EALENKHSGQHSVMSSSNLNDLKHRLRDFAQARDWEQLTCKDALMPWAHGCAGTAHSPKNLTVTLSAEMAEIVEYFQWFIDFYRVYNIFEEI
ncbi:MAG: hypothetical protein QM504_08265, partial [Pseudomonadota bacterium]